MRIEENNFFTNIKFIQTSVDSGLQVDVYIQHNRPVALVLWRGNEPQPHVAIKDSDDGRFQRFTLTANDDVPAHDRRESHQDVQVETFMRNETIMGHALRKDGSTEPFLTVVCSDSAMRKYHFNNRSDGIFANGFRDSDALPVDDTFGATIRSTLHGREGRDWSVGRTAALIAQYSSRKMDQIVETVNVKSRDDAWREKHQDKGLAGTDELAIILRRRWADTYISPHDKTRPLPIVAVEVEPNTFSFFVTENAEKKTVRVHQFTDFRGTILEGDFPFGSAKQWSVSMPKNLTDLEAVDAVGPTFLKDWATLPKTYPANDAPPYDPNDMDAACAYSQRFDTLFAKGDHDAAYALYMRDPNGGALDGFGHTKEKFVAIMYSKRDGWGVTVYPEPEGYQAHGLTVGHQAHLRDSDQWARIGHIYEFENKPYAELDFGKRVSSYVDGDGRRQVITYPPDFPDGGSPISTKLMVEASEIDQTEPLAAKSVDDSLDEPGKLTDDQRAAVAAYRDANGDGWKDKLNSLWMNGNYSHSGIDTNQAALLQQVRNQFGPHWLELVENSDLIADRHKIDDPNLNMSGRSGMTLIINRPASGELPECAYELVGVFNPRKVLTDFGEDALSDFAKNGHPRKYWPDKGNGSSVYVPRIPGRDETHPPFAVFVATNDANPNRSYPPHAAVIAYRNDYPCLHYDDRWQTWEDVVHDYGGTIAAPTPDNSTGEEEPVDVRNDSVVLIELGQMLAFQRRLDSLNKKALAYGLDPIKIVEIKDVLYERKIEYVGKDWDRQLSYLVPVSDGKQVDNPVMLKRIEIEYPVVKLGDWQVIGKLEAMEGGNLMFSVSRDAADVAALSERADHPIECDHCKTKRFRKDGYLLRNNENSSYMQVGSNCLEDFTGIDPSAALFLARMSDVVRISEGELEEFGRSGRVNAVGTRKYLTDVSFITENFGFISAAKARDMGGIATYDEAVGLPHLLGQSPATHEKYTEQLSRHLAKADTIRDWIATKIEESTFDRNLKLLLSVDAISLDRKHLAFAAASVPMYNRSLAVSAEARNPSEHIGAVGHKMTIAVTVDRIVKIDGPYGPSDLVVMHDDAGNKLLWKTSACPQDIKTGGVGRSLEASFKVKEHGEYNNTAQTKITHLKVLRWLDLENKAEADLDDPSAHEPQYRVSIFRHNAGEDHGYTNPVLDAQLVTNAELVEVAQKWGISHFHHEGENQWFCSLSDGQSEIHSLHMHDIDGREPSQDDFLRVAQMLGIEPRQHVEAEIEHPEIF